MQHYLITIPSAGELIIANNNSMHTTLLQRANDVKTAMKSNQCNVKYEGGRLRGKQCTYILRLSSFILGIKILENVQATRSLSLCVR